MFRYPVYFVHHNLEKWADICFRPGPPSPAEYGLRLRQGNDNWVLQTYFELKRRGLNVDLTNKLVKGALCLAHYDDIILKEMPLSCFLVGIRGDRPDIHVAAMNVVQNMHGIRPGIDFFMPHWSQPGLQPRNAKRGTNIVNIGYFGMRYNLHPAFRNGRFESGLKKMGMQLLVREYPFQDYTDIDVVLAVRPGTSYDINIKPATKLQNAWLAECPAILGRESAYQQYRRNELDYIEATSTEQALSAIRNLKENPAIYAAMIENCRKRAHEYTHDSIVNRWIRFLSGPVMENYERWLTARRYLYWYDYVRFPFSAAQHKFSRRKHQRSI